MLSDKAYDAIVVGSGPNGLAAAIELARAGLSVLVIEANSEVGGGARTSQLTLPGFQHDVCSSVFPLGIGSPFFNSLPLEEYGLKWIHPSVPLAHPIGNAAVVLERSVTSTAEGLRVDKESYMSLFEPLARDWCFLQREILAPPHPPHHPICLARFGRLAWRSSVALAHSHFETEEAKALFAGLAAHSVMPLERLGTAAFGFLLGLLGHAVGWPFAQGGAGFLTGAMESYLRSLGAELITNRPVRSWHDVPPAKAVLFDTNPAQLLRIAGEKVSTNYRRQLKRFRHGPGVFKLDWALSAPIPWKATECRSAGTVHVGGNLAEIMESESAMADGKLSEKPFVLVTQPSLFDNQRGPRGHHVAWAYCHVPHGS